MSRFLREDGDLERDCGEHPRFLGSATTIVQVRSEHLVLEATEVEL